MLINHTSSNKHCVKAEYRDGLSFMTVTAPKHTSVTITEDENGVNVQVNVNDSCVFQVKHSKFIQIKDCLK